MADEKQTITVRCPKCKKLNILIKGDFKDSAQIAFRCSECGDQISLENPDFGQTGKAAVNGTKISAALDAARALFAYSDDIGMIRRSRKGETASQVAGMVEQACTEVGIEPESEEYKAVMHDMLKAAGCEGW